MIIIYDQPTHFIKSIIEELKTRNALLITISSDTSQAEGIHSIQIPSNPTFNCVLSLIAIQLLAYHLSVLQGLNPDMP